MFIKSVVFLIVREITLFYSYSRVKLSSCHLYTAKIKRRDVFSNISLKTFGPYRLLCYLCTRSRERSLSC